MSAVEYPSSIQNKDFLQVYESNNLANMAHPDSTRTWGVKQRKQLFSIYKKVKQSAEDAVFGYPDLPHLPMYNTQARGSQSTRTTTIKKT